MKKKMAAIMVSLMMVLATVPMMGTAAYAIGSDEMADNIISLSLDYDQLTTFNTSHNGNELSAEILQKIDVQSQYRHAVVQTAVCSYDSGSGAYKAVGDTALVRGNEYFLAITVSYTNYPSATRSIRFNGRTLTKVTTGKPSTDQFVQGQWVTINSKKCDVFYIAIEGKAKWCGPDPYLLNTTFTYTGSQCNCQDNYKTSL